MATALRRKVQFEFSSAFGKLTESDAVTDRYRLSPQACFPSYNVTPTPQETQWRWSHLEVASITKNSEESCLADLSNLLIFIPLL
jgi:hypothetical protein